MVCHLSPERLKGYLAITDLSQTPDHAISIVLERVSTALRDWSDLTPQIERSSPISSIHDNYDALYYDGDAVARSTRYSHYVDDARILRTHTTAMVPRLLREVSGDTLLVCPGLVYRRDVMDRTHVGEPHQVDLWVVRRARLRRSDLLSMIDTVIQAIVPGAVYRCNETIHPYTMNGLEVEVLMGDRWIEVLECGEAHPWVLNDAGLDIGEWSGLAMGIGLDRLVMLLKGLDDIRLLRSADPRVAAQMRTLEPYRPVSRQPAAKRDMSLCVTDPDMELIGDRVRVALGDQAGWLEEIELISTTSYEDLPEVARTRLGMLPHQVNLLIRLHLRDATESIPRDTANLVYRIVYGALHENETGY